MLPHRLNFPVFIGLCALYLAVPASMIWQQERILRHGAVYRFRLQPVDPADAFRGRYLDLNLSIPEFPVADPSNYQYGQKAFVSLEKNKAGYAQFLDIHREAPANRDYLAVRVDHVASGSVFLSLSDEVTRYYLNEKLAPLADKWYMELLSRTESEEVPVSIDLRVRKGKALVERVYFEDTPVEEYIRRKERE